MDLMHLMHLIGLTCAVMAVILFIRRACQIRAALDRLENKRIDR